MHFKKIIGKIHLWLGLASGLVVFFLGITGCILAFEREIRTVTDPYQFVAAAAGPLQPPSVLKANAEHYLTGKKVNTLEYNEAGKAAVAAYYDAGNFKMVYLNPYTGAVLKVKNMNRDFFRVILNGHYYLWLPPRIGQPVIASATLIFLVMLITGIVLWWPRNKAALRQRFSIKWNATWKRLNYDLHNVFGFYMSWIVIFVTITGLVWGFQWFEKSVYWISSGGRQMPAYYNPPSDTLRSGTATANITNTVWQQVIRTKKSNESVIISFVQSATDAVAISINHRPGTYYNMNNYYFDQYSGAALTGKGTYAGSFKKAALADKIKRMNYDIHVGAVLGLPGKIMAFFASLIAASLPVTGFYIWWGRNKKNKVVAATKNLSRNKQIPVV